MEFFLRKIYPWLIEVGTLWSVVPLIAGLFLLRKPKQDMRFWLLFLLAAVSVLSEGVGQLVVYLGSKNNLWVMHTYTLLEFLILAAVYYYSFNSKVFKRGIILATVFFVSICYMDAFVMEGVNQMNSAAKMVNNALLMLLSILYFYKVANDQAITYLDRDPIFLLSCSLLIYKAGTTMSYALFNQALAASYDAARICITIILVLNILYYTALLFILKRATT
ncbi:hypothetical protein WG947_07705 [Pontibacter sp. H259]|uniref:hypothetical protein n=1 Tax=Pontibacter sp. H259 TaxID=3133421 RepID=UPI0030BFFBC4